MKRHLTAIVGVAALAISLAACGGKAEEAGTGGSAGGAAAAPGVTDDTITLGALVDLTAVFAPNSKSILAGTNLYWDEVNKAGGVCKRQVKITTQDHAYDPQKAVALYRDMSPNVLALSPVLGSSVLTALAPSFKEDNMVVGMAAWSADVLPNPSFQITGATYDLEMINALEWLTEEKGLKKGDKVGHVYFEGDFGGNSVKGSEFAAEKLGLTIVKQQIKPTDTDLSSQVNQLKQQNVKAILVAAGSPQTASVASVASSIGLDVPIVGDAPAFTPALMDTPAGAALEKNFYTSASVAPPAAKNADMEKFLASWKAAHPDQQPIQNGSVYGYAAAGIMHKVLEGACDNLTREGVQKSLRSIKDYQAGTVAGTLDYSDPAQPPTRAVYISKADKSVEGRLMPVGEPYTSKLAEQYTFSE